MVGVAALAMIATPVASAAGTVRFVATPANGGSDTGNSTCASTSPCATITKAVANSVSGDFISVGPGSFGTPQSTSATITIGTSVTIDGAGAGSTTLVNSLVISPGVTATVALVTIDTADFETGVLNEGTLTLGQTVVTGNSGAGTSAQGDIVSPLAAGIANVTEFQPPSGPQQNASPSLTLIGSTVNNNNDPGDTAGISLPTAAAGQSDTATIVNSTIAGNSGTNGAIYATGSATTLTVFDTTITGNTAQGGRTGGLGIGVSATATVTNTILAANSAAQGQGQVPSDCNTDTLNPAGSLNGDHDLIGNGDTCTGAANGTNGDEIGTAAAPLDPGVGPLAANGGPTPTEALAGGSAAIRAGDVSACEMLPGSSQDQRGDPRNASSRQTCDIGAYDTASAPITLYVNSGSGHDSGCAAASQAAPFATLTAALGCAANGDAISLAAGNYGTAQSSTASIALARNLTLSGAGASTTLRHGDRRTVSHRRA